jgi:hypothetical protein
MDIGDMIGLALAGTVGAVAGQTGKIKDGVNKLKARFSLGEDNTAIGQLAKLKKLFPKASAEELLKLLNEVKLQE